LLAFFINEEHTIDATGAAVNQHRVDLSVFGKGHLDNMRFVIVVVAEHKRLTTI
jgi:hypothetical protein